MENSIEEIDDESLICDDPAVIAAQKSFGIKYLYPWQRLVIANILDSSGYSKAEKTEDIAYRGRQIVLLPTGAGKSLCFQIPALLLNGPTLVLYPLLALMADQKRRMDEGELGCVVFRGNQTTEEREENFRKIAAGAKIILANPEVLQNNEIVERLASCGISHAAIDEAHCVSEWGDSFRPAYLTLGTILKKLRVPVITAFTATASPTVLKRVAEVLFDGEAYIVRSESDRPNIHYYVQYAAAKKQAALLLSRKEARPMIIFCGTRHRAEDMSRELNTCFGSETSRFYHAGLEKSEKDTIEKWFFNQSDGILCATCAYGMGVDKKDIHTILHLDAPNTAESYIQEAGRAARDGSIGKAILLWSPEDSLKFSHFPRNSREYAMKEFAETELCRRQVLLNALGAEQAVCSGCDVCDAKNGIAGAMRAQDVQSDAMFAFSYIRKKRKSCSEEQVESELEEIFNKKSQTETGLRIWEHSGISEILAQLKETGQIKDCGILWKGMIQTCTKKTTSLQVLRKFLKPFSQMRSRVLLPLRRRFFHRKTPYSLDQRIHLPPTNLRKIPRLSLPALQQHDDA